MVASRSRATLVTSTSTTCVSWAPVCNESTIRSAMILRSRLIFSVVPRRGEGVTAGADPEPAPPDAGAAGAAAAGAGASLALAASSTSCLRIRPPTPEPDTEERSTLCWLASLRTRGVT